MVKKKDLKKLTEQGLNERLEELRKEMIKINAQISTGTPPENKGGVKQVKKNIARILTYLNQNKSSIKSQGVKS
ncbi:50S ribosomal protein L29 [archaeon]|jgi:large subunit ribosomal protein L29|nr:50S ribosomal protein L29 [archaeon]|tara:strand:- start:427 stop:648 length:222 start_codon:yes stop_codon:yes gene_type:complete